jgi:hypothetical protein
MPVAHTLHSDTPVPENEKAVTKTYIRRQFYRSEGDPSVGGQIPVDLTKRLNLFMLAMKISNYPTPRCIALNGEIEVLVDCSDQ